MIHPGPTQGVVVGGPAHHGSVDHLQLAEAVAQGFKPPIDFDGEIGSVALELVHQVVAQGRDGAVLLGIQALQPGFAGMHAKTLGPSPGQGVHKVQELGIGIALINANAVLHGDR